MHPILDAIANVPPLTVAKYALIGGLLGAILTPPILYVGLKLNLEGARTSFEASRIPQTPRLYLLFSIFGAALFAILGASQPILDAAGDNEVYIRAALLPVILLVVGWPFVRALKRHRARGG